MSDPERVPPSGGPGHWRRWLLPVLASAAWLVLTFCLYRHAVQGEQAHLLELCHTRLAATAHQLMDARDWNAGHGGVYVPLSAYGEPNPWLPEKDRTLQTADGRTLVLMNPAYMSRQMAERLTEPGFRLAIVGQAPLRPGNRADDWERRILATATQGGQVFFSGEDCLPQGRLRLLRTLAAQESCLRCHQGHKEGDMLGGISISMDAAAYVRDLERKQRELGLLYGLLALTGVLAVGGITSNLTLRRLQAEEKSRLKSAFMGRLSHDMRTPGHAGHERSARPSGLRDGAAAYGPGLSAPGLRGSSGDGGRHHRPCFSGTGGRAFALPDLRPARLPAGLR